MFALLCSGKSPHAVVSSASAAVPLQGVCTEVEEQTNHMPVFLLCCETEWIGSVQTAKRLFGHVGIEAVTVNAVVLQETCQLESWPSADKTAAPGPVDTFHSFLASASLPTLPLGLCCIAMLRPPPATLMERVVRQRHEEVFGETNPLEPKCFFGDLGLKGLAKSFAGVYTVVLVTDVENTDVQ